MKMPQKHYSNYLISVQFDHELAPTGLEEMMEACEDFLFELGQSALKSGVRLHATFGCASGQNGYHAHFGTNWLPLVTKRVKTAKMSAQPIARRIVSDLLEDNGFYVDNPKQAIKRITHDKEYVTNYIITQPKDGQSTLFDSFYIHPIIMPVYSETKGHSYCTKQQMVFSKRPSKNGCNDKLIAIGFIVSPILIAISFILLAIF